MSNRTVTKTLTVVLKSGKYVTGEVEASCVHDEAYGADADGNRGVAMDFIEELEVVELDDRDSEDNLLNENELLEAEMLLMQKAEDVDWDDELSDYDNDFEC